MFLRSIRAYDFRNLKVKSLGKGINVIYGNNGQEKTNGWKPSIFSRMQNHSELGICRKQ